MTSAIKKKGIFDDETSQEDDSETKSSDSNNNEDTEDEEEFEMSGGNQEGNPSTWITTIKCIHPSSVITDDRIYEYIHRDYFVDPKSQQMNTVFRNKDVIKWDNLKKKVVNEIKDYLKTRMIVEAQKKNLKVRKNNVMVAVCKWSDIGLSFSQYSTKEIAMKLNIITKTQFQDDKIEETIMEKCSLKYTAEKNDKTTKSCIARLITEKLSYLVS